MQKDLLGIRDLSAKEIMELLKLAKKQKQKIRNKSLRDGSLKNASITTLFYENSTRTKLSFLLAGEYCGAHADDLNVATSSVNKGETLVDTGLTLDRMGTDAIIVRHGMTGAPHLLAKYVSACVINGGDGSNEHPTQALLDLFTMWEQKGGFEGLRVTIAGDIANSRVARSNIYGLTKLGAQVTLTGPSTLLSGHTKTLGVRTTSDVREAVEGADVVMALRIQMERQKTSLFPGLAEYTRFFGLNADVLRGAKKDAIIMHPGPVNRGVEISTDLMDGKRSVIYDQVENGVATRMAVLERYVGAAMAQERRVVSFAV